MRRWALPVAFLLIAVIGPGCAHRGAAPDRTMRTTSTEPGAVRIEPGLSPETDTETSTETNDETNDETGPGVSTGTDRWIVLSPGLRINRARSLLEFDGTVAVDCHNPTTPDVYLELVACSPDTREHESLVVTPVPPSLIHAGLLALGFEPGRPGGVVAAGTGVRREAPSGDPLSIRFVVGEREQAVSSWITDVRARRVHPAGGWVFAGSRFIERGGDRVYDADGAGTVIGLTTFGSETIAYSRPISPDSWVDEPLWIADPNTVPARGTPVIVRIGRVQSGGASVGNHENNP